MAKILVPTTCPCCGTKLETTISDLAVTLFCPNKSGCEAQSSGRLEKFCKALSIKGFGPATLQKLPVKTIPELLALRVEDFITSGFSELMAEKLHTELTTRTRFIPLEKLLVGLAITGFGETAAKTVAANCTALSDIKPGIVTPRLTKLLEDFLQDNEWVYSLADRVVESTEDTTASAEKAESNGLTVVITGSLNDFKNRTEGSKYLESLGFTVKSSVTKGISYLVCEDETKTGSSSYKKAQQYNIPVVTIRDLAEIYK